MPFPDPLDRTVRTITATCTRVSRESIIVPQPGTVASYRRLTIRERASLQGFPVTFQFYGANYSQKLRMVGNAIPPLFTYFVAHAFRGTSAADLVGIDRAAAGLAAPSPNPDVTSVDTAGAKFPANRTFRFAIPSLRLKSGVRFELGNQNLPDQWRVAFWFGTSKDIKSLDLRREVAGRVLDALPAAARAALARPISELETMLEAADLQNMQKLWSHRGPGRTRPFMLLDELDQAGQVMRAVLAPFEASARGALNDVISDQYGATATRLPGLGKLDRNAALIVAGIIVGALANSHLAGIIDTMSFNPGDRAHST